MTTDAPTPSSTHAARRLEALSDIVFGLAMTFLASRLPLPGASDPAPTWHSLAIRVGPSLSALALSFTIAGIYWFGHHRRLSQAAPPTSGEIVLNFAFLLVVMLLPATTELVERFGNHGSTVSIYAAHLTLLSGLYLLLWYVTIHRSHRQAGRELPTSLLAGPAWGFLVFLSATLIASRRPGISHTLLFAGFLGPFIARLVGARRA